MKQMLPLFIILAIFTCSSAQKNLLHPKGAIGGIFQGQSEKIAVCERDSSSGSVALFSKKLDIEKTLPITDTVVFPDNDGFEGYIAYIAVGLEDTATHFQSVRLKFLNLENGKIIEAKYPVKVTTMGRWLDKGRVYCMGGKTCLLSGDGVKVDRVSSVVSAEVSPDLKFCMNAVVQKAGAENIKVNIELENLTNQDMLNVDAFQIKDDGIRLIAFSDDPRYVYYRAGNIPTLYDVKKMQGVTIPDVTYKIPEYFGFFLKGERFFYFYDFYSIASVDKKSFVVDEVFANPFNKEFIEIGEADNKFLRGALYVKKEGGRKDYTKLFSMELRKKDFTTVDLPVNVQRIIIKDKQAGVFYTEDVGLLYKETQLK